MDARDVLTQRLMRNVSTREIASILDIDEDIIIDCIGSAYPVKSLDSFVDMDSDISLLDKIGSNMGNDIDSIYLHQCLDALTEEELDLIYQRYFQDKTQSEVANSLNTSQVKVSRCEKKILVKLKKELCDVA